MITDHVDGEERFPAKQLRSSGEYPTILRIFLTSRWSMGYTSYIGVILNDNIYGEDNPVTELASAMTSHDVNIIHSNVSVYDM